MNEQCIHKVVMIYRRPLALHIFLLWNIIIFNNEKCTQNKRTATLKSNLPEHCLIQMPIYLTLDLTESILHGYVIEFRFIGSLKEEERPSCLQIICLLVLFLFVVYRPFRKFFRIAGEGLQILTSLHSLPLSSEGSLACHTYCVTGHPFIMAISEDSWHSHLLQCV